MKDDLLSSDLGSVEAVADALEILDGRLGFLPGTDAALENEGGAEAAEGLGGTLENGEFVPFDVDLHDIEAFEGEGVEPLERNGRSRAVRIDAGESAVARHGHGDGAVGIPDRGLAGFDPFAEAGLGDEVGEIGVGRGHRLEGEDFPPEGFTRGKKQREVAPVAADVEHHTVFGEQGGETARHGDLIALGVLGEIEGVELTIVGIEPQGLRDTAHGQVDLELGIAREAQGFDEIKERPGEALTDAPALPPMARAERGTVEPVHEGGTDIGKGELHGDVLNHESHEFHESKRSGDRNAEAEVPYGRAEERWPTIERRRGGLPSS